MAVDRMQGLQEKRLKLSESIKAYHTEHGENWSAENETVWTAMNAEYDAVIEEQRTLDDAAQRATRLEEIERQRETERFDASSEPGESRQRREEERTGRLTAEHRELIFRTWAAGGDGYSLSDEVRKLCEITGINPSSAVFLPRDSFSERDGERYARLPYVKYGPPRWSVQGANEKRDLEIKTATAGPETIPEGFQAELAAARLAFGGPQLVSRMLTTASGNDLVWPTVDDTANSATLLAESTTVGASVDPTFGTKTFNAYKYKTNALISPELIQDSAFNLATELGTMFGIRLGRGLGAAFTTGTGTAQPNGVVTAAGVGVTAASGTLIAPDELFNLVHSLDPAWRSDAANVGFMMHDNILLFIRKLKDTQNQYLWVPGLSGGSPDRLLGYPVTINQHMSGTLAVNNKTVLFANFSQFIIRDVAGARFVRANERYIDTDQIGFFLFSRHDSDTVNAAALKVLQQAAV